MLRSGLLIIHPLPNVAGSAADRSTFLLLNGVVGDGPRAHSTSTSRRAGRDNYRFFTKKKRTSNQEGGPRVLRSGLLIIHPLPNVAGSAADRSTFFLLNGVVGDGPRAHSNSTSRRAGRDNYRFFTKKKRTSNQEGGPRVLRSGLLIIHLLPNVAGSAADRSTFFLLNGVVGDGPRAHSNSTSRRAGRDDHRFFKKKSGLRIKKADLGCLGAGF